MSNHDGKPNRLIADHGDWQEWDISTSKYPAAVLKIDTADMVKFRETYPGRVFAFMGRSTLYAYFYHEGKRLKIMHRVILDAATGAFVDHANHDGLDNRRSNIRIATSAENNANRTKQKNNTSGAAGVGWCKQKGKWRAQIKKQRKVLHIGFFANITDAIAARKNAEREHFGVFAYTETSP